MMYCLWIGYVILKIGGMVFFVKLIFLKYRVVCLILGVIEMYNENFKKEFVLKSLNFGKKINI